MIVNIKKYIQNKFFKIGFNTILNVKKKYEIINKASKHKIGKFSFGNKNKHKIFYVIKRTPGAGFFSNLLYVIKNLDIAEKNNYIPIVDMCNFPTMYNQKININNKKNIWEIYFKQTSNFNLKDVYKSKNVYFSPSKFKFRYEIYKKKKYKKIFDKYIKVDKKILTIVDKFVNKYFKDEKILGIHFRGTDQLIAPNHSHPPTIFEIENLIEKKVLKGDFDKIFLLTEDLRYFNRLKKKYKELIYSYDYFRAKNIEDFSNSKRRNHRNKLGFENLVEAITLSKCNKIVFCESNISMFAIFYSNFKISKYHLNNGIKSSNTLISRFSWYLSIYLPKLLKYYFKIQF